MKTRMSEKFPILILFKVTDPRLQYPVFLFSSEIIPAYSDLIRSLKTLTMDTTTFSELLVDLAQIVDTMDIVVDPHAHIESLQDQHEQLVLLAQQFQKKIANLSDEQRQRHAIALEKLTTRVETLRLKLIKAIEDGPKTEAEGKMPMLTFGEFNESIDWNDNSNVDIASIESNLIDIAMDLELNPPTRSNEDAIVAQVESTIEQKIANEQANEKVLVQANETPNAEQTQMIISSPSTPVDQTPKPIETATIPTTVAQVENGCVIKLGIENVTQKPIMKSETTSSSALGESSLKKETKFPEAFSLDSLKGYNELSIELLSIPVLPEPATTNAIRKLREFITGFIKTCEHKRIGIAHFTPVLMASIISALSPTIYQAWESHMLAGAVTLDSIRSFLTNQEARLIDRKFVADKFLLARAIKESKELIRAPPKPEVKVEPIDMLNHASSVPNSSKSSGGAPLKLEFPAQKRGRVEFSGNESLKSRDSSASSRNGAKKGGEPKRNWECLRCKGPHALFKCKMFLQATLAQRWNYVNNKGICALCLTAYHSPLDCTHGECKNHPNEPGADTIHNSTLCIVSFNKKQTQ